MTEKLLLKEFQELIAKNIRHRLELLGLSEKEFAVLMGVPVNEVRKWLSGSHNFLLLTLYDIGIKLEMPENIIKSKKK